MAELIRSAKSGSDWTGHDLLAYNITVQSQSAPCFFGHHWHRDFDPEVSPIAHLDPNSIKSPPTSIAPGVSPATRRVLQYLDLASQINEESIIDEFARSILEVIGFNRQIGTAICVRHRIPLTICRDSSWAACADVCLLHLRSTILLVVQEDKSTHQPVPKTLNHKSSRRP
jgi:hypothetical protein